MCDPRIFKFPLVTDNNVCWTQGKTFIKCWPHLIFLLSRYALLPLYIRAYALLPLYIRAHALLPLYIRALVPTLPVFTRTCIVSQLIRFSMCGPFPSGAGGSSGSHRVLPCSLVMTSPGRYAGYCYICTEVRTFCFLECSLKLRAPA